MARKLPPMKNNILILLVFGTLSSCEQNNRMKNQDPPMATARPHELNMHGHTRIDPYYWLNERENPEVISYLEAENAYAKAVLAHTEPLQEQLFSEIKGRIKEEDMNVPWFENGYWYYTRYEAGKDYPIYCRKFSSLENKEEVMFDVNRMAEGSNYYSLTGVRVSPDNKMAMFFTDEVGRRQYTLSFKNLETGEILPVNIFPTNGAAAWANDNTTVFYGTTNEQTLRSDRIWKYRLGEAAQSAQEVYFEVDETFSAYVFKGKSKRYIYISCNSTMSDEQFYLDADRPDDSFKSIQPRIRGLEYSAEDYGNDFFILTNRDAQNFKLVSAPIANSGVNNWRDAIEHRPDVRLEGVTYFKKFLVIQERKDGLTHLRVRNWQGNIDYYIEMDEPAYYLYAEINRDYDTDLLRYGYTSLVTPNTLYSYNMASRQRNQLKQQDVVGGYNPNDYLSERIFVVARDGARVPVSLVYKKNLKKIDGNPTLLYGYGSYGASMDAYFSVSRLSLLDRGFVFAIAHIRGGEEMGRQWYEDGKLLNKKNTFYDFIDCGEAMIAQKYAAANQLFAMGGSAGGLLMGAVINMRPDLWKGVVASVPFVDVVTTMLDESIPLTTGEFDEWGNPNDKVYYDYMLSYSPYDNVSEQVYPHLLVTTGLHDSQVQYWEPAKWVAKLRTIQAVKNKILLVTDMEAGHGGKSGRFNAIRDTALEYAFLLDLAQIKK
jgi:oligopeptidase B